MNRGAWFHRPPPGGRITPEAIALFRQLRNIQLAGHDEIWEQAGGRRREFIDGCVELHDQLGRRPWQTDVMDVGADWGLVEDNPIYNHDNAGAIVLRRQLEALA
jgi:hypothetical protein